MTPAETYWRAVVELLLTYPAPEDSEKLVAGVRAAKARTA